MSWYHASQGPSFRDIAVANGHIDIRCTPARRISIQSKGSRCDYVNGGGITSARFDTWPSRNSRFHITITDDVDKQGWSNPVANRWNCPVFTAQQLDRA